MQPPAGLNGNRGQQVPQQPFGQPAPVPDLGAIREAVQELYGPDLMQISPPRVLQTLSINDRQGEPLPKGVQDP